MQMPSANTTWDNITWANSVDNLLQKNDIWLIARMKVSHEKHTTAWSEVFLVFCVVPYLFTVHTYTLYLTQMNFVLL